MNKNPLPVAEEDWTATDEESMDYCNALDIHISETALGEEHSKSASSLVAGIEIGAVPLKALETLERALQAHRKTTEKPSSTEEHYAKQHLIIVEAVTLDLFSHAS